MKQLKIPLLVIALLLLCLVSCNHLNAQQTPNDSIEHNTLVPREELTYNAILYYEYAEDAGYYSCMYVTYDTATIWNSTTPPDINAPTASAGFELAYTETIDPTLYINAVRVAVESEFEKLDAVSFHDDLEFSQMQGLRPLTCEPETHIAVYNTQGLVLELGRLGEYSSRDSKNAFTKVYSALTKVRANMDLISGTQAEREQSQPTAILNLTFGNELYAEYRTADKIITWSSHGDLLNFNYDAPLQDENCNDVKEYVMNGLIDVPDHIDRLPFYSKNSEGMTWDGNASQVLLFYYEDGSRVTVSRSVPYGEGHPIWAQIDEQLDEAPRS